MTSHRDSNFQGGNPENLSRNGNSRFIFVENLRPRQSPMNSFFNDPFFDFPSFPSMRRNFFSTSNLFDEFFSPSFHSSFFQPHPYQPQFQHSRSEPMIEDVSETNSNSQEQTQQPTYIEEIPEEEEWEIWDDWEERKQKTRININVEEDSTQSSNQLDDNVIILDSDDEVFEDLPVESKQENDIGVRDDELREVFRASYLSLSIKRNNRKAGKDHAKIVVQLPNGKRVKNTFNKEDNWDSVKQWVSFEMAKDKSISNDEFLLENEYELAINNPLTVLTSNGSNIVRKISEFSDKLGKRLLVIIHRIK